MKRFIFMLALLLPLAAYAQEGNVSAGDPDMTVSSPAVTSPLPEGTPKGHALPPPGMDNPVAKMDETCAQPTSLIGQPKSVLETMKFANPIRVLEPGSAATMDYSPSRTNIIVDKQGIIREIRCG